MDKSEDQKVGKDQYAGIDVDEILHGTGLTHVEFGRILGKRDSIRMLSSMIRSKKHDALDRIKENIRELTPMTFLLELEQAISFLLNEYNELIQMMLHNRNKSNTKE